MKQFGIEREAGASLIESLIALVVLSVGLLGIGLLQLQSKQLNLQSIQRTEASMLANDIVERMRNNRGNLASYLATVGGGAIGTTPDPACTAGASCSSVQLAAHDLWQWEQSIDGTAEVRSGNNTGGLQSATGCITGPAGGVAGVYSITIAWRGKSQSDNVSADTCGADSGKYDETSGDNVYRRLLSLNVHIEN